MKNDKITKEAQYKILYEAEQKHGRSQLGIMSNETWNEDPRRLVFVLSRYKFVAKLLEGKNHVLEIGCADAFATRIVQQAVKHVTVADFDPLFIDDVNLRMNKNWPMDAFVHDMLLGPIDGRFDAAYALDVLEHINTKDEDRFIRNMAGSISEFGTLILGMPSLESQQYASDGSKEGHVNCKSGKNFKALMLNYFHTVFMFSMNDEVVHTGFFPMANYLFAVCCHPKLGI